MILDKEATKKHGFKCYKKAETETVTEEKKTSKKRKVKEVEEVAEETTEVTEDENESEE